MAIYNAQHGTTPVSAALALTASTGTTPTITAATIAAEQGAAIPKDNASTVATKLNLVNGVVQDPVAMANDGVIDLIGSNAVTTSDNKVNAGTSDGGFDVVVLGTTFGTTTLASSNEVVTLAPNFGTQVIVHFDGVKGDSGQDQLDLGGVFGQGTVTVQGDFQTPFPPAYFFSNLQYFKLTFGFVKQIMRCITHA
jgi:hypothetical protein